MYLVLMFKLAESAVEYALRRPRWHLSWLCWYPSTDLRFTTPEFSAESGSIFLSHGYPCKLDSVLVAKPDFLYRSRGRPGIYPLLALLEGRE